MNYHTKASIYGFVFLIIAILPISCIKNLTTTNIVYQNDFEQHQRNFIDIGGWSNGNFGIVNDLKISNYNGNNMLGNFNNNSVQLTLQNLPAHQAIRVEFDLYLHNQWNNDLWRMTFDGGDRLLTGFSNDSSIKQSYPNWYGIPSLLSPAGNDAMDIHLPGTCTFINSSRGTSLYRIVNTMAHSMRSFVLSCNDAGGVLNDTCKRSWSMDNLKISVFKN